MKLEIYAIYDIKAGIYATPFFMQNDQMALRAFLNLAKDPNSTLAMNPEDFQLFKIGDFDDQDASITSLQPAKFLAAAPLGEHNAEKGLLHPTTE